jgi:hypothetical protein
MSEIQPPEGSASVSARIVAQAASAPAQAEALNVTQRAALAALASGKTIREAAASAGIARWTLHRWLRDDPDFRAAFNAWRQELIDSTRARLLRTAEAAAAVVHRQITQGDGRLALALLDRLGLAHAAVAVPGPTDPAVARDAIAVEHEEQIEAVQRRANENYKFNLWFHGRDHLEEIRRKFNEPAQPPDPTPPAPPEANASDVPER